MLGKRIESAVADLEDRFVFDRDKPAQVADALTGARVTGVDRRGKYFWIALDRKPWVLLHLGMTGNVRVNGAPRLKLWSESRGRANSGDGSYTRLRLTLQDGVEIAITDPRRFGRIRLTSDPLNEPEIRKLGFDPLAEFPSARELHAILARRRAPIKAVLLDQKVFAGVGNWIADEVLYQARIAPRHVAARLSLLEITRLRSKLLSIVRLAVEVRADSSQYPQTWLFHHRWGRRASGRAIVFDTVGGRTTAWVPALQKSVTVSTRD